MQIVLHDCPVFLAAARSTIFFVWFLHCLFPYTRLLRVLSSALVCTQSVLYQLSCSPVSAHFFALLFLSAHFFALFFLRSFLFSAPVVLPARFVQVLSTNCQIVFKFKRAKPEKRSRALARSEEKR
jgi:hypothetical protein